MALPPGSRLGRYEIRTTLGVGGMGEVYRARDTRLQRDVALKILRGEASSDPVRFRRFEDEARSAALINHPNIVAVYDISEAEETIYIITELIDGGTLADSIRNGDSTPSSFFRIAVPIAEALAAAHVRGIVHRDLKPENILLSAQGEPKIADFGLAKLFTPESGSPTSLSPTVTRDRTEEGSVLGTVAYMSPEQSAGKPLDARSDQFSLGVILCELVTGNNPFRRESAAETFAAILREQPALDEDVWAKYPAALKPFLRRCLEKNPRDRYASTEDLSRDLRSIAQGASAPGLVSQPPLTNPPARRRTRLYAAASAAIVLAAISAWIVSRRTASDRTPSRAGGERTLAILPFRSDLADGGNSSLRLGFADALISKLSSVRGLLVRPTSSVRRYESKSVDPREVSRDLAVDFVLDGSIQSAGERIRAGARLTRAEDGKVIWSESFDDQRKNIFSIHDRIAASVLRAMGMSPSAEENRRLSLDYTASVAAYDLYQEARAAYLANTKQDNARAVDLFGAALAIDSDYAPAHAGLAFACARYSFQYFDANPAWAGRAEQEASLALEKGPFLAEAHLARAQVLGSLHQNFDFVRALPELRRSLELSPYLDLSRYSLGVGYCGHLGLFEEGIAELKKASEINAGWSAPIVSSGWLLGMQGKYDAAVRSFRQGLAMTPGYSVAHEELAEVLLRQGKPDEAAAECAAALQLEPKNSWAISLRAVLAARDRRTEDVARELDSAIRTYEDHHVQYNAACAWALSGNGDRAIASLRRAVNGNFNPYPWFRIDPLLDGLRANPEFSRLLEDSRRRYEVDRAAYRASSRPSI